MKLKEPAAIMTVTGSRGLWSQNLGRRHQRSGGSEDTCDEDDFVCYIDEITPQ